MSPSGAEFIRQIKSQIDEVDPSQVHEELGNGAVIVDVREQDEVAQGKLPGAVISQAYTLEYGEAVMEMHDDSLKPGERVLIVDDLLATGGTAEASIALCRRLGAEIVGCGFVIDLPELGGRQRLEALDVEVHSLCEFAGV